MLNFQDNKTLSQSIHKFLIPFIYYLIIMHIIKLFSTLATFHCKILKYISIIQLQKNYLILTIIALYNLLQLSKDK